MRKLVFSAIACVAFAGSSLASNEAHVNNNYFYNDNVESNSYTNHSMEEVLRFYNTNAAYYPCQFSISVISPDGELLEFHWVIGREGGEPCLNRLVADAAMLQGMFPEAVLEFDIIAM
ncbi:MAG TPA: hypothetical protein VKY41_07680 [Xanthomarina sp.]|nr:hypothetical protein [Xanthomarina sp.]